MKGFLIFILQLWKKVKNNELVSYSNAMTYKLILSIFPFIIFVMSLFAFFDFNLEKSAEYFIMGFPVGMKDTLILFLKDIFETKRIELLSFSFVISLFSASSGVVSMIKGLNKAYEAEEKRGFIKIRIISAVMVVIIGIMIMTMMTMIIFKDKIIEILAESGIIIHFSEILGYIIVEIVLLIMVILVYKIALCRKVMIKSLIPGGVFDLTALYITSKVFNIYINNFSRYSAVYGGIGSLFVMMLWINLMSMIILIGGQINYMIESRRNK